MKKILVSMMTIAMVSALIGGGIYAAFSDPETSGSSGFGAGTLDLTLGGENDAGTVLFSVTDWEPGEASNDYAVLRNVGSLSGVISFQMSTADSLESTGTTGTADNGTITTIVDDALDQAADDYWVGYSVVITSGTNVGETRVVTAFVAGTHTITVGTAFSGAIDSTSKYALYTEYERDTTGDQAVTATSDGSTTTIIDSSLGGSDDDWNGYEIQFTSGSNDGEVRTVTDYVAATGTVTFSPAVTSTTTGDTASLKVGELSAGANIALWIDTGSDGSYDAGTDYFLKSDGTIVTTALVYTSVSTYSETDWGANTVPIAANIECRFYVDWDGTGSAGNTAQGDSLAFSMDFGLDQD